MVHYFKVFRERKLEPNIHSYAICLYGIYNVAEINKKFDHLYIHRILEDIEKFVNFFFLSSSINLSFNPRYFNFRNLI